VPILYPRQLRSWAAKTPLGEGDRGFHFWAPFILGFGAPLTLVSHEPCAPGASNEVPANARGWVADCFCRLCFEPAPRTLGGAPAPTECRSRRALRRRAQPWGKRDDASGRCVTFLPHLRRRAIFTNDLSSDGAESPTTFPSSKRHCKFSWRAIPWNDNMVEHRGRRGGASMRMLLSDIVLFSCVAAFVTGIVIAVASLLS
jgi:hypothetical protein